jgi:hypothetical protein
VGGSVTLRVLGAFLSMHTFVYSNRRRNGWMGTSVSKSQKPHACESLIPARQDSLPQRRAIIQQYFCHLEYRYLRTFVHKCAMLCN